MVRIRFTRCAVENSRVSSQHRPRSKTARELAQRVRGDGSGMVYRSEMSLMSNNSSVLTHISKDAVRESGIDPEDPPTVPHYEFRDLDMVVIDLSTDGDK